MTTRHTNNDPKRLRGAIELIVRHLEEERDKERRKESEYRIDGRDQWAESSHERAFAYDMTLCFIEGVMASVDGRM